MDLLFNPKRKKVRQNYKQNWPLVAVKSIKEWNIRRLCTKQEFSSKLRIIKTGKKKLAPKQKYKTTALNAKTTNIH